MGEDVRCENVLIIDAETECAKRDQLVERICQHKAIAKMQKVKNVLRKGVSAPTEEEISCISAHRERLINKITLQRQIEDVRRQQDEWLEYISYERDGYTFEQTTQAAADTTSLEGRAIVLLPLLSLFRILLCDNRAKRRLSQLRTKQLLQHSETAAFALQTPVVLEAVSTTGEQLAPTPASANPHSSIPKQFLMPNSFIRRPLRKPFVFVSREYQLERIPEFSIDFSDSVTKEYSAYVRSDHSEPFTVTLADFVQPLITLETFDLPKRAYEAPFKQSLLHGCDSFVTAARRTQTSTYIESQGELCAAASSASRFGVFSRELTSSGPPKKLPGPVHEDSLSDSESEETPRHFQTDLSWLPSLLEKKDDTGEETLKSPQRVPQI